MSKDLRAIAHRAWETLVSDWFANTFEILIGVFGIYATLAAKPEVPEHLVYFAGGVAVYFLSHGVIGLFGPFKWPKL